LHFLQDRPREDGAEPDFLLFAQPNRQPDDFGQFPAPPGPTCPNGFAPRKEAMMLFLKWFLALALAAGKMTGCSADLGSYPAPSRRTPVVDAVAKSRPAIVLLRVAKADGSGGTWTTTGTGVIVDEDGDLVTTCHTITGACGIRVHLSDGAEFPGRILAVDRGHDLALLRFHADAPVQPLELGRADDLLIGETVVAVGHPYGYAFTVSTGVISALGREIAMPHGEALSGLIQVDANINPGNSGGPLLNVRGDWIGLMVAVRDGAQGIAFAINADTIRAMLHRHLGPERGRGPHRGVSHAERALPDGGSWGPP
jgi:serine protease Do